MPQLSLYLDETTMANLRLDAERDGVSLSKYVGNLLQENDSSWPPGWFDVLGSLADIDFPLPDDLPPEDRVPALEPPSHHQESSHVLS